MNLAVSVLIYRFPNASVLMIYHVPRDSSF